MDEHLIANLLTLAGFTVMVTVYVVNARNAAKILGVRLEVIDASLEDFKREMRKLGEILVAQALQSERLNTMDQRLVQEGRRLDRVETKVFRFSVGVGEPER